MGARRCHSTLLRPANRTRLMENEGLDRSANRNQQTMMIANTSGLSSDRAISRCWVISDGAAGNENQALALARALGLTPRVVSLDVAQPWGWLAPRLCLAAQHGMRDRHAGLIHAPWPAIAIGCGRRAALLTRCLRKWSSGRCFTAQILDPRISPAHFDVVVAPRHDGLDGDNVIVTRGALNAIDDAWLAEGCTAFASFDDLPRPRTAVLIGASNSTTALDDAYFEALFKSLEQLHARSGGCFLVSTSRRTPRERIEMLRTRFLRWPGIFWSGPEDGRNPYAGILGWADQLIVSADSVNMISEACATGKPVHAFAPTAVGGKLGAFHQSLRASGHLTSIEAFADVVSNNPLRESANVAEQIRQRWIPANG